MKRKLWACAVLLGLCGSTEAALDSEGWTELRPAPTSRVYYVSSSEGNDANAGTSPAAPLRTTSAGKAKLRTGQPDWLLFKRGDTWDTPLGLLEKSGVSADEPLVIGAYGAGARPIFRSGSSHGVYHTAADPVLRHARFVGLHFDIFDTPRVGMDAVGILLRNCEDVLVEDCFVRGYGTNIIVQATNGAAIRRCVIVDAYHTERHAQGLYADTVQGLTVEECVFDHNGWREGFAGAEQTIYNHHMYITSKCGPATVRGNILSRASATGVQARSGGVVENNFLIRNPIGMTYGLVYGGSTPVAGGVSGRIAGNVIVEANDIGSSPRRVGVQVANINADGLVMEGNIFAAPAGEGSMGFQAQTGNGIGVHNLTLIGNVCDAGTAFGVGAELRDNLVPQPVLERLELRENYFAGASSVLTFGSYVEGHSYDYARVSAARNRYRTPVAAPFLESLTKGGSRLRTAMSFDQWRQRVSDDGEVASACEFAVPSCSIAGYQSSVGGAEGFSGFIAAARSQGRAAWDPDYTAQRVLEYFREGYRVPALPTAPPPVDPNDTGGDADPVGDGDGTDPGDGGGDGTAEPPVVTHDPLTPGAGFEQPTPQPVAVGGEGAGSAAVAIARWDVVPFQAVAGVFEVGVVAFHANGIDRVEFSAAGGPWQAVTEMTLNPRTNVAEYWTELDTTGLSDRQVELRAIAYPNRGVPRVLDSLWLTVNTQESVPPVARWVSTNGDDAAGDGTSEKPFKTPYRAAQSIHEANGSPHYASGGVIYLRPGDYPLGGSSMVGEWPETPTTWLTLTPAPGVDRSHVRITQSHHRTAMGVSRVRLQGLTIHETRLTSAKSSRAALWLDGCALTGDSPVASRTGIYGRAWPGGIYATDCRINNVNVGLAGADLARSITMQNIGGVALYSVGAAIGCSIEGMPTGRKRGSVLAYGRGADNVVAYNIEAKACSAAGLVASAPTNAAFANVLFDTDGSGASVWRGAVNHLLLWHVNFPNEPLVFANVTPRRVENLSVRNSVFLRVVGVDRLPTTGEFANGTLVPGVDNNHFVSGPFVGTNATQGAFEYNSVDTESYFPADGSILDDRVYTVVLPYDLEGDSITAPGSIGPRQVEGSATVTTAESPSASQFEPLSD